MQKSLRRQLAQFMVNLTVATVLMVGAYYLLPFVVKGINMPKNAIATFLFLYAFTAFAYYVLLFAIQRRPAFFIHLVLASMVVKLLCYCIFIFVVLYLDPSAAIPNAVLFLGVYFVYTMLEVSMAYLKLNAKKQAPTN